MQERMAVTIEKKYRQGRGERASWRPHAPRETKPLRKDKYNHKRHAPMYYPIPRTAWIGHDFKSIEEGGVLAKSFCVDTAIVCRSDLGRIGNSVGHGLAAQQVHSCTSKPSPDEQRTNAIRLTVRLALS